MQWWQLGVPILAVSCGDRLVTSPFPTDPAGDAGGPRPPGGQDAGLDRPSTSIPTEVIGGPCVDDAQCDDGIDCTFGSCDPALGACRYVADDARCSDGVFCNGVERCDPRLGCTAGPPTSCSDSTPCTIDRCDEATLACVRTPRDIDADGNVDGNCEPGADCNDLDPRIASTAPELCNNQRDDDCDGETDEGQCQVPEFDTCAAALPIGGPGSYVVSPAGAALDYGASCAAESPSLRELVLSVDVPEGPLRDLEIVARAAVSNLALARAASCGAAPGELECARGALLASGDGVARLHLSSPPPGLQSLYLYTDGNSPIQVEVSEEPATLEAANVSCDQRLVLEPGEAVDLDLGFTGTPLESACGTGRGDRYVELSLDEAADVLLVAESLDGYGDPRISVRTDACLGLEDELRCNQRALASTRLRALGAGTYVAAVSATGPTRARLTLDVRPPSVPPAGDQCTSAPALTANVTEVLSFVDHDDDIGAGCSPGSLDAARRLDLAEPSDVLLVARFSPGDVGAVTLSGAACSEADGLGCTRTADELARVSRRGLAAGEYRVVGESILGLPATVLAAVRPSVPPTLVPGADTCADALTIGAAGGFYQGNTANADPDFTASCDFATPNGGSDQLLRLVLPSPQRVILDMRGSDFDALLNLRRGPACPGDEVAGGCAVFSGGDRSFLDLDLQAGEYFVQIDGYAGASGNWFLNVFVL